MSGEKKSGTFDRLVSSISDAERKVLLEKMHTLSGDPETQALDSDDKESPEDIVSLEDKLKSESFFYRFFLWLRSVFSNSTKEELYNQDKVAALYKQIDHSFPGLVDYKEGYLLSVFYQKLTELKKAIEFFRPYLDLAYENLGVFYVFLGSIICPEVTQEMDSQVDPYQLPLSREVTGELRTSFLRKIDDILKNIPSHRRSYMYSCVTTIEWFYQFLKLPFDRFLNSFSQGGIDTYCCKFEIISNEISNFARILCNGGIVPEEVLTSLYLFSSNKIVPSDSEAKDDDGRMKEFMDKATGNISMIHMFVKTVPLKQIARIAFNNVQWQPDNFSGAEDWFMKYKDQWKKMFEEKWNLWLRDKKKEAIHEQLEHVFGIDDFPLMPNRPWSLMWEGIPFHFEYTTGFIHWFMDKKYNEVIQPLKLLLLEGAFINKDNRQEFANTLNDLGEIYQEALKLSEDLSPKGQIGLVFDKIASNHLRTLQAQSKIESTMLNVESIAQSMKNSFCEDCRSIKRIVDGALGNKQDTRYDGVSNITTIKGAGNDRFQTSLMDSRDVFVSALDTLKELEPIDLPGIKPEK
ncbi:MAG: hypothetical protein J6Y36_09420 [Treponema sp.]|uniref:DUF5312 family protein n=1 Tax=Treponema sp. TaxID=166 RepID=UPI001B7C6784|nr:DUF5312 family protein [Treponema sp.]MBP5403362.1 hypothetical protein [Treponema sp.]MBR5932596.1 hypothetical protein [Treponema sp.]